MNEKEFKNYIGNNIKSISSKISLEEINFLGDLIKAFNEVCMKYDKSQNNWNELKKWLEECLNEIKQNDVYDRTSYEQGQIIALESSIAKVQELEQGKDE